MFKGKIDVRMKKCIVISSYQWNYSCFFLKKEKKEKGVLMKNDAWGKGRDMIRKTISNTQCLGDSPLPVFLITKIAALPQKVYRTVP